MATPRYTRNRVRNSKIYWTCVEKTQTSCQGTDVTCNNTKTLISKKRVHNHTTDEHGTSTHQSWEER